MVENFVNVVEWILLVNDGIEEDSEGPDILLFASVCFALKDFWCSII
jgi:hypothetical protein